MRRHDLRMLTEAAHSITRFDPPLDRQHRRPNRGAPHQPRPVVNPAHQTTFVTHIPHARLIEHDDGHIACARTTFNAPMLTVCRDVAWRANT